jgi:hypothetical protein
MGVWFSIRFSSFLLYRNCKRLCAFEEMEISRQICRGDCELQEGKLLRLLCGFCPRNRPQEKIRAQSEHHPPETVEEITVWGKPQSAGPTNRESSDNGTGAAT